MNSTTHSTGMSATHPKPPSHNRTMSMASNMSSTAGEDIFSSIPGFDDFAGNDDELDYDLLGDDDSKDSLIASLNGDGKARKLKRPASTAEKKATHNAVERARRESLNGRFLVLADMLPGMNHVKRASKAAIVNKSIELIKELQATETRVSKENEALKAELATLRAAATSSANGINATAAMFGAAQGLPHIPMMPLPVNMAAMGLHHGQHLSGMPPTPASPALPLPNSAFQQQMQEHFLAQQIHHHQQQQAQQQAHQQQQQQRSNSATPLYPGVFNGLFNNPVNAAADSLEHVRSESGSPPGGPGSSYFQMNAGYYDIQAALNAGNTGASPRSVASAVSPPGTAASLQTASLKDSTAATSSNNTAPSPASSHSIPTPLTNPYSPPTTLPTLGADAKASNIDSPASNASNAVVGAYEPSAEAALIAAQFAPRDLAKAQLELQSFIAYQQRLSNGNTSPQPYSSSQQGQQNGSNPIAAAAVAAAMQMGQNPFLAHSHSQAANAPGSPASAMNIPAWQMIMAQQHALTTAYGGQGHF